MLKCLSLPAVFNYGTSKVRTITDENGEPWFVAADVCAVLEIGNPTMAVSRLDREEVTLSQIEGSHRMTNIVNESGLYSLILRSEKPQAKAFKRWVTSVVLPTIRKKGSYNHQEDFMDNPEALLKVLLQATQKVIELNATAQECRALDY